jgi:integrase
MGRKSTGTVRILKNEDGQPQWHAKWTRADGTRTDWEPLPPSIRLDDLEGAKAAAARMAVKVRKGSAGAGTTETVAEYAGRWLDDRDGRVNSIRDDRSRMRDHVLPVLGPLDVLTFGRDDVESLRDALDRKIVAGELSWKTAANVWTLLTGMCADTANAKKREFRVRGDNPGRDVKPPERGVRKAKQYLYPSEFLAFVSCSDVPLRWRRAVALAVYTYGRDGEVSELRWDGGDVDLEHGVLSITRSQDRQSGRSKSTKTGGTRRFSIEPNLLPLLQAMHDRAGGKGSVFDLDATHLSRTFRRWLLEAGVTRTELHSTTATSKAITWHDLRATGATWMAIRGDDPLKIKQRCGHASFSTTEMYIREAEAVREGFGAVFPALPEGLAGIAPKSPRAIPFVPIQPTISLTGSGTRGSNP